MAMRNFRSAAAFSESASGLLVTLPSHFDPSRQGAGARNPGSARSGRRRTVGGPVLTDSRPHGASHHPAHDEEVEKGRQRPIPDPELRAAEAPRAMIHGN